MNSDLFAERLAQIRARFAAKLPGKISSVEEALPRLQSEGEDVFEILEVSHRSIHELCGIAPTIGFPETGLCARHAEQIMLQPLRARRGLSGDEAANLRAALERLRAAAESELQSA